MQPKYGYMVKQIVFCSFDHPFQDGYKRFHNTDIVSLASLRGILEPPSTVFSVPEPLPKVGVLLACFVTDAQIANS